MHEASKSYIERSDDRMCLRLVDIRGLLGFEAVMDFQVLIIQKSRVSTLDGRNAINFCPPISKLSEESRVVRTINPCLSNSTRVIEAIDAGALWAGMPDTLNDVHLVSGDTSGIRAPGTAGLCSARTVCPITTDTLAKAGELRGDLVTQWCKQYFQESTDWKLLLLLKHSRWEGSTCRGQIGIRIKAD